MSKKLIRLAAEMGYEVQKGSKHWKLRYPRNGFTTTLSFGSKLSTRSERNQLASLRRGAKLGLA